MPREKSFCATVFMFWNPFCDIHVIKWSSDIPTSTPTYMQKPDCEKQVLFHTYTGIKKNYCLLTTDVIGIIQ